jgi:hypothetical protein
MMSSYTYFSVFLENFTDHEIDLTTFASLTDSDLREIGISTVGARRKMLWISSGE